MNIQTPTTEDDQIKGKILHLLSIFPKISPSMMQIGIGSGLPASIWRGKLQELIEDGLVAEDIIVSTSPTGRTQSYTVIRLATTPTSTSTSTSTSA